MNKVLFPALFLMGLSLSACNNPAPIIDSNEPNDSVATAAPLEVGKPLNGAIAGQARDHDYFKFSAKAGDMLRLTVRGASAVPGSTLDPYVMILMPDGKTVLERDDDSGANMDSDIRFNVPADGTYTVVVTSFKIQEAKGLPGKEVSDDLPTNLYQISLTKR